MTIEEKVLKEYGRTDDPVLSVWMLRDGTLVNGSCEGFQRDIDHHQIISFFSPSRKEDPGSPELYVKKFIKMFVCMDTPAFISGGRKCSTPPFVIS